MMTVIFRIKGSCMPQVPRLQRLIPPSLSTSRRSAEGKSDLCRRREMGRLLLLFAVFVLLNTAVTVGCSRSDGLVEIRGTVTFDSQPVEEGLIAFVPAGGETAKAEAVIQDGAYSVGVMPGEKIVEIRGFKTVGHEHAVKGNPDSPLLPIRKDIVPSRYNDQSELKRNINADASIENFDLTST